jgi:hypothetical protein
MVFEEGKLPVRFAFLKASFLRDCGSPAGFTAPPGGAQLAIEEPNAGWVRYFFLRNDRRAVPQDRLVNLCS